MPALSIQPPFPVFADKDGTPLENGYIWVGTANLDPQGNQIMIYWDDALTIPAAQPIRTIGGYPSRSGTPAALYAATDFSIRVLDKNGIVVYSAPQSTGRFGPISVVVGAADVSFTHTGSTFARNVQSKLDDTFCFNDWGALGNDSADDTAEMQALIDYVASLGGGSVFGKPGSIYKISAPLVLKSGVRIDLAGSTVKQYANNSQIVTAPTNTLIESWALTNGTLRYNTKQDGTCTVNVTVSGILNPGDYFIGLTSGATGRVVSVSSGILTYLAGVGTLAAAGEQLSVNSQVQANSTSVVTTSLGGSGLRLAIGAFSYNFLVDRLTILDAYDGIECPSTANTFAFVGQITNYVASVGRWAINYDCDSNIGGNTNVILQNCWHVHSQVPAAPFSSGFRFNACAMFRWDSLLADKIEGQFLFAQTSSGEMGTLSLEAANVIGIANLQTSPVQLSDSSINIDTLKFVGNSFKTYVTMTVASVSGAVSAGQEIVGGTSTARGRVVSLVGTRLTLTQDTINANFTAGETWTTATASGTVSGAPSNSGQIYLLRATSAVRYNQFSSTVNNFVTSGNNYAGQLIYDCAPTADGVGSGPFNIYNTQATLDRTGIGFNITGAIRVGDTITGATSGASGVAVAVGTFLVLYKPSNPIPWTVGENVNVLGVPQGTSLGNNIIPGYFADFAATPSIKTWNGIARNVLPDPNYADAPGYIGLPQNARSANYTLVFYDAGRSIVHPITDNNPRTFTIPPNSAVPYPVGTEITFVNMINTLSIAITTDTMYLSSAGTTGTRTLAAFGVAKAIKVTSTSWIINGTGLT